MRMIKGVIGKVAASDDAKLLQLGKPLNDPMAIARRVNLFAEMRPNADGFRIHTGKRQAKPISGMTRSERKSAAKMRADELYIEQQANVERARSLGPVGLKTVEPQQVAALLTEYDKAQVALPVKSPRKRKTPVTA